MKRTIIKQLEDWKQSPSRKPLILMGARQVGKTYILRSFAGKAYSNHCYVNFEDMPTIKALFQQSLEPKTILKALSIEFEMSITPGETLIIFDEIQECPDALNSLKYFCEAASEYHVCAAGSLLGVKLAHTKGFPVGKVNFLKLYPLSFYEFLLAHEQNQLAEFLVNIHVIEPLPENLHEKLNQSFKTYLFVGGMPEAVKTHVKTDDFNAVRTVQKEILNAYSLDFAKHAPPHQIMKINQVWESIASQLAKENKKFIYSVIRKGARAKEFETAIQWLVEAGLIHKTYHLTAPKLPLSGYVNFDFFKVYLVDVGLLGAKANLSPKAIIHGNELLQEFKGTFTENYTAQELARNQYELYYWSNQNQAELDFIIQEDDKVYPLEIKAGMSNKKKSLQIYAAKYHPSLMIRCSPKNLKLDNGLLNCPLYLLSNLRDLLT